MSPARAAGLLATTLATNAPVGALRPSFSAISRRHRLQVWRQATAAAPRRRRSWRDATTTRTMFAGTAKPMPCEPPEREKIAVLMPTSRPVKIDQRTARIAGIDRGVGLDEELIVGDADLRARHRRDDAMRHGLADAERIADRKHDVADLERVGIAELERPGNRSFASLQKRSTARSERGCLSARSRHRTRACRRATP